MRTGLTNIWNSDIMYGRTLENDYTLVAVYSSSVAAAKFAVPAIADARFAECYAGLNKALKQKNCVL